MNAHSNVVQKINFQCLALMSGNISLTSRHHSHIILKIIKQTSKYIQFIYFLIVVLKIQLKTTAVHASNCPVQQGSTDIAPAVNKI